MTRNLLGEYLRARRAQVSPDVAGVGGHGPRRVPGLRREEVATLAGVSADYYVRLEQGRERHPSAQVIDALSDVLRLDEDARLHLLRIAGLTPGTRRGVAPERVDPRLLQLMDMWPNTPAIVAGRAYDVLAANRLAHALYGGFAQGPNLLAQVFLDPDARAFYPDWERVAEHAVAGFRLLHGQSPHDPRVLQVLDSLTAGSEEFVALWQRHDAREKRSETKHFRHPEVGELTLHVNTFDVKSAPGQQLVVYHAEPGSVSAEALTLLGTIAATRGQDQRTAEHTA